MTEIAVRNDNQAALPAAGSTGANLIREAAAVMADAHQLAQAICKTQMIPKHFHGKPDECAAAMLYGASLGFDPMQSVRQIYVVHGQAALYARAMDALVKGAGHETWTVATSDESVTVAGRRKGADHIEESTWTFERAKKAGYTNNEKYRTDPQAMLYSKALSEVCRKIAPDVLNGVYSVEEMQMERPSGDRPATRTASGLGAALGAMQDVAPQVAAEQVQPEPEQVPHEPASITKAQLTKLHTCLTKVGLDDRDQALAYYARVTGRDVESSKALTKQEATWVIEDLQAAERGEPNKLDPEPAADTLPVEEPAGWGGQA